MRTVYIDDAYICHAESADGRTAIQTDVFDGFYDAVLPCYRFVPIGTVWNNHILDHDFIQCVDSKTETVLSNALINSDMIHDVEIAALIEEVYQEDLYDIFGEGVSA